MTKHIGHQLGNYRLIQLLGEGAFAEVYLGEHVYLKTQAAVKILQLRLTSENLDAFLTEARIIAGLRHPHIVRVLDFGVDNGVPFLVMDYASNGTLRQYYPRGTRLPFTNVLSYVRQVTTALQYAHDKKLIHRDVKPENMLLGADHEILLSDFGIAVIAQSTRYGSTQEVAGTVTYMAPEQIQGKPRSSSDQYALGIVVYEWLSGDRPFHGSFAEIASQHLFTLPAPLYGRIPTISHEVEQVVMTALAKDPHRRFENVLAFADALEQASHNESSSFSNYTETFIHPLIPQVPISKTQHPAPPEAPTILPPHVSPAHTDVPASRHISRRAVIIGLAGLAVAGGGITALVHSQGTPILSHNLNPISPVTPHSTPTHTPSNPTTTNTSSSPSTHVPDPTAGITLPFIYRGHTDQVYTVSWSPDGTRIASGGRGDNVQVWDAATGKLLLVYHGYTAKVYSVAWSPDSVYIASGHYDGLVQVWNASTGNLLFTYRGHPNSYHGGPNWINSVAWSPDGMRIASGSHDTTVQICDAANGNQLLTYQRHSIYVNAVAWSPDGTRIASGSGDKTVQVWNTINGNLLLTYQQHSSDVEGVAWSPNGTRIASGGLDDTVQIWNSSNGNPIHTYRHSNVVNAVAWSPNGAYIASGGDDTMVQVWNASEGKTLLTYRGHTDVVQALVWSPDSQRIASASNDMTVQICSLT